MNTKLNYGQYFSYKGRLYKVDGWDAVSIDDLDDQWEEIDIPNINDVILLSGHVEVPNGHYYLDRDGYLDRDDGPAIDMYEEGYQAWYKNGKPHRDDGPAVMYEDGSQEWYKNGKCHRVDGPAVIRPDGYQVYRVNDQTHRVNGPAIVHANGEVEYWINDNQVTEYEIMFMN